MKKGILWLLLIPAIALGQGTMVPQATVVEWDDPNPVGAVEEFKMYCASSTPVVIDAGNLTATIAAPTTEWTINMAIGHYYCAVSAAAGTLESGLSNEVEFTVFGAPVNFRIR